MSGLQHESRLWALCPAAGATINTASPSRATPFVPAVTLTHILPPIRTTFFWITFNSRRSRNTTFSIMSNSNGRAEKYSGHVRNNPKWTGNSEDLQFLLPPLFSSMRSKWNEALSLDSTTLQLLHLQQWRKSLPRQGGSRLKSSSLILFRRRQKSTKVRPTEF